MSLKITEVNNHFVQEMLCFHSDPLARMYIGKRI